MTSILISSYPLAWITVAIIFLVTTAAGLSNLFKFRERGFNQQQAADAVEKELNSFELRIFRYSEDDEAQATRLFAEEVERLKEEQRARELQLEQSPEHNGGHAGTGIQIPS